MNNALSSSKAHARGSAVGEFNSLRLQGSSYVRQRSWIRGAGTAFEVGERLLGHLCPFRQIGLRPIDQCASSPALFRA